MQIKPLRSMYGSYGSIRRGVIANIPDHIAQQLVKRGVAVPVQEVAKNAPAHPRKQRPSGSQTGGAKQSSSSPADQASKTSPSKKSGDGQG